MRLLWILCLVVVCMGEGITITHEELVNFVKGFLRGQQIQENYEKLIVCLDDSLGGSWQRAITMLKSINWNDINSGLLGVYMVINKNLETLEMLEPCSEGEVAVLIKKMLAALEEKEKFMYRIMQLYSQIVREIQDFIQDWDRKLFEYSGKTVGALMHLLFNF